MWKKIWVIWDLVDPVDKQNYTYTVNKDLTRYELLSFVEGEVAMNTPNNTSLNLSLEERSSLLEKTQADEINVITKWHKLWVLLTNDNIPVQRTWTGVVHILQLFHI